MGYCHLKVSSPLDYPMQDAVYTSLVTGENIWLHLNLIKSMIHSCQEVFPVVEYANISIPSYPSGQIGAILCSTNPVWLKYAEAIDDMKRLAIAKSGFLFPNFVLKLLAI